MSATSPTSPLARNLLSISTNCSLSTVTSWSAQHSGSGAGQPWPTKNVLSTAQVEVGMVGDIDDCGAGGHGLVAEFDAAVLYSERDADYNVPRVALLPGRAVAGEGEASLGWIGLPAPVPPVPPHHPAVQAGLAFVLAQLVLAPCQTEAATRHPVAGAAHRGAQVPDQGSPD